MESDPLQIAVRDVLLKEWNPIGVDVERAADEYDRYVSTICRWLREGVDEHKLVQYLSNAARVNMGLSHVDRQSNLHIARRLLELER